MLVVKCTYFLVLFFVWHDTYILGLILLVGKVYVFSGFVFRMKWYLYLGTYFVSRKVYVFSGSVFRVTWYLYLGTILLVGKVYVFSGCDLFDWKSLSLLIEMKYRRNDRRRLASLTKLNILIDVICTSRKWRKKIVLRNRVQHRRRAVKEWEVSEWKINKNEV